jgi:predicted dehydrogenase
MKKVIWGVLSTAKIGTQKVIPAMQQSEWCDIRAIASRHIEDAKREADALGIRKAYGSYEELLADPEIEAVYNPLPNHLHIPLTLAAVSAGKHVLCEKPIALTADEAKRLIPTIGKALVMEAFMVRFHPQWLMAREFIEQGRIGTPRSVQVFFSYFNNDPNNIRNQASIGGGAVYDIGCYAIVAARFLFKTEAIRAIALFDRDPTFGTDRTVSGLVDFGYGRQLDFTVSTQSAPFQRVIVNGTDGRIELPIPFNPNPAVATRIYRDNGSALDESSRSTETIPLCNQYTLQGTAFSRAIRGDLPLPYGVDDAIRNLRTIDAIFRSEKSGRWEDV